MRFARLFEFEAGQLLLNIATDSEIDGYVLNLEIYYQGQFIRTGLPFASFGDASEKMEEITEQGAEALFDSMSSTMNDPTTRSLETGGTAALQKFEDWIKKAKN